MLESLTVARKILLFYPAKGRYKAIRVGALRGQCLTKFRKLAEELAHTLDHDFTGIVHKRLFVADLALQSSVSSAHDRVYVVGGQRRKAGDNFRECTLGR